MRTSFPTNLEFSIFLLFYVTTMFQGSCAGRFAKISNCSGYSFGEESQGKRREGELKNIHFSNSITVQVYPLKSNKEKSRINYVTTRCRTIASCQRYVSYIEALTTKGLIILSNWKCGNSRKLGFN